MVKLAEKLHMIANQNTVVEDVQTE
jgi:hypothetical protein